MSTTPSDQTTHWTVCLLGALRIEAAGRVVVPLEDNLDDLLVAYLAVSPEIAHLRRTIAHAFWPGRSLEEALKRLSYVLWLLRRRLEKHGIDNPVLATRATLRLNPTISTDIQGFRQCALAAASAQNHAERTRLLQQAVDLYGDGLLPSYQFPWLETERTRLRVMHQEAVEALSRGVSLQSGQSGQAHPAMSGPWGDMPELAEELSPAFHQSAAASTGSRLSPTEERDRLVEMVERADEHLAAADRSFWLARLDAEYPAIEATLEWSIDTQARAFGLRVASALWRYWDARSRFTEGQWFIERLLVLPGQTPSGVEARARHSAGMLACRRHDLYYAQKQFEIARVLWRTVGDALGEVRALADLAAVAHDRGDYPHARQAYDEAVAIVRQTGDESDLASLLSSAARTALRQQDSLRARDLLSEGLEMARQMGDERLWATLMARLASVELAAGDDVSGATHAHQALEKLRVQGDSRVAALALRVLGLAAIARGHYQAAITHLFESLIAARQAKDLGETGETLRCLAEARKGAGDKDRAAEEFRQAAHLLEATGDPYGTLKDIPRSALTGRPRIDSDDPEPPNAAHSPLSISTQNLSTPIPTPKDLLILVQEAEPHLAGEERAIWLDRLDARYDAIRAVLENAVERSDHAYGLPMTIALWRYWYARGKVDEGRWFLEQLLPRGSMPISRLHAKALHAAGTLAIEAGDLYTARGRLEQALAIWRELDDDAGLVKTLANLGKLAYRETDYDRARKLYGECLAIARRQGDTAALLHLLLNLALTEMQLGDLASARLLLQERLSLIEQSNNKVGRAETLTHLASVDLAEDNFAAVRSRASEAETLYREFGNAAGRASALRLLGRAAHEESDFDVAVHFYSQSLDAAQESGSMREVAETLRQLARTYYTVGDLDQSSAMLQQAAGLSGAVGDLPGVEKAHSLAHRIDIERRDLEVSPFQRPTDAY